MAVGAATANITQDESWFHSTDRVLEYTVLDENDAVVNITGWAMTWTMRENRETAAAILTKTVGSGIAITDGANGVLQVTVSAATDYGTLTAPKKYWMVLERTDSGSAEVLSRGEASLLLKYSA